MHFTCHYTLFWGEGDGSVEIWIEHYHTFLQTDYARNTVPSFHKDLRLAQERLHNPQHLYEDDPEQMQTHEHDDWMQICQLNPWFNTVLQCDPEFDWAAYARQLPDNVLKECPKWISKQCLLVGEHSNSIQNQHIPSINIDTLNPKQLRVYNYVKHHFTQLSEHHSLSALHMIVSGTAGTGKSYPWHSYVLGSSCILTATTGMASFNMW